GANREAERSVDELPVPSVCDWPKPDAPGAHSLAGGVSIHDPTGDTRGVDVGLVPGAAGRGDRQETLEIGRTRPSIAGSRGSKVMFVYPRGFCLVVLMVCAQIAGSAHREQAVELTRGCVDAVPRVGKREAGFIYTPSVLPPGQPQGI